MEVKRKREGRESEKRSLSGKSRCSERIGGEREKKERRKEEERR